jgi:transcriptional regulator with XRE-family HTH domain
MYLYKVNKTICSDYYKNICNNEIMKEYSDRLKYALDFREISQSDLARAVGVKSQAIQYLCDKGKRSVHSVKIAKILRINAEWLTEGIGVMAVEDDKFTKQLQESNVKYAPGTVHSLTISSDQPPKIKKAAWKALSPETRSLVENFVDTLNKD